MGRHRKSQEIHAKRGNPRKQAKPAKHERDSRDVPPPDAPEKQSSTTITPPPGMAAEQRKIWDWVVSVAPFLNPSDSLVVARYCDLVVRYKRAKKEVGGVVTFMHETDNGRTQRMKPAFAAEMQIAAELRQLEDRLGLNPNTRTSIASRRADTRDPDRPASGAPAAQSAPPSDDPNAPPKPASPIGLLAGTQTPPRGPLN